MTSLEWMRRWYSDGEVRWYLTVVGLSLLGMALPAILAYGQSDDGLGFVGMLWSPADAVQYFAAMREGATTGSWLIHDHLSTEPHDPILMYAFYVGLGKLTWLLGLDPRVTYHLAELVARATLVVAVLLLADAVLPCRSQRRVAVVLVLFGTGPFLVAAMVSQLAGGSFAPMPENVWLPELSTLVLLQTAPHMILSVAFALLAGRAYLLAWSGRQRLGAVLGAAATCAIGLTNVFVVVPLGATLVAHLGLMWWTRRRAPREALGVAAAMLLVAGTFLIYNLLVFRAAPFWQQTYGTQTGMGTPPPLDVVLLIGGVVVLAVPGLASLPRPGTPAQWLLVAWTVSAVALMYLPLGVERRFALGLQPVLTVAAAPAVVAIWRWLRRGQYPVRVCVRPLLLSLLGLALMGSTLPVGLTLFGLALNVAGGSAPTSLSADPVAAMLETPSAGPFYPLELDGLETWLAQETGPDDRLLAAPWTANVLARWAPGRFYVGHGVATLEYGAKTEAALAAYRSSSPDVLPSFMRARQLKYVIVGPYERAVGIGCPINERLRPVYSRDGVEVFELIAS